MRACAFCCVWRTPGTGGLARLAALVAWPRRPARACSLLDSCSAQQLPTDALPLCQPPSTQLQKRRGYAEETYIIVAPRYPGAALTVAPLGGSASSAAPLPSGALVTPVASPAGPAPQRLPDGEPREQAAEVEAEEEQRAKPAAPPAPQGVGGSPPPPAPVAAS